MIGFMLDGARALENRQFYRRFIDFIADRGADTLLWHFSDDQGCAIRFDTLPAAASPNAFSKDEVRQLKSYAQVRGVSLIPELATLGHTRYITGVGGEYATLAENDQFYSSICPIAPLTRQVIGGLLDETLELFDSPLIHVGMDETNLGGHPLTAEALKTRSAGELYVDYARYLHERITARGRRMMMWGDYPAQFPQVAADLPKDILLANWQYDPDVTPDQSAALVAAGFEVVACPALFSFNQTVVAGESWAYPNVRAMSSHRQTVPGVTGTITTLWTPTRYLSESIWPAVDYAAAVMLAGKADVRERAAALGESFYGLKDVDTFADAIRTLADAAPARKHWLPVCRLNRSALEADTTLDTTAGVFETIAAQLQRCRPGVRRNEVAFDALQLTVDVLSLAWRRAVAFRDGHVDAALIDQSRQVADRLADAWDQSRYRDDPRRERTTSAFDEQEHLRWTFEQGTAVLAGASHACAQAN